MNYRKLFGILVVISTCLFACTQKDRKAQPPGVNCFSDPSILRIAQLQDERNAKGLLPFLKAKDPLHREKAALAYASLQDTMAIPYLLQATQTDEDVRVRRAAAYALGQIGSASARQGLMLALNNELDFEGKVIMLEALGKCADSITLQFLQQFSPTQLELVRGKLKGLYRAHLSGWSDSVTLRICREELRQNRDAESNFYAIHTLLRSKDRKLNTDTILARQFASEDHGEDIRRLSRLWLSRLTGTAAAFPAVADSSNPYHIATAWKNMAFPSDNEMLNVLLPYITDPAPHTRILSTTAAEKVLEPTSYQNAELVKNEAISVISICLHSGDMALQSLACNAIQFNRWGSHEIYRDSISLLAALQQKLKLPEQAETFIDFEKALAALKGAEFKKPDIRSDHPVDWDIVRNIPADQRVLITTTKGGIEVRLFVEDAPGSVCNFLQLVDEGFYDGKYFHRVVPDFVIQGGCPRGDGWGSLNWTQRSEFSSYQKYEAGTMGLASAGKDTEGVQFFITHMATPHLDGRYSIFGRVVKGMEIVDRIEMGDRIVRITRLP